MAKLNEDNFSWGDSNQPADKENVDPLEDLDQPADEQNPTRKTSNQPSAKKKIRFIESHCPGRPPRIIDLAIFDGLFDRKDTQRPFFCNQNGERTTKLHEPSLNCREDNSCSPWNHSFMSESIFDTSFSSNKPETWEGTSRENRGGKIDYKHRHQSPYEYIDKSTPYSEWSYNPSYDPIRDVYDQYTYNSQPKDNTQTNTNEPVYGYVNYMRFKSAPDASKFDFSRTFTKEKKDDGTFNFRFEAKVGDRDGHLKQAPDINPETRSTTKLVKPKREPHRPATEADLVRCKLPLGSQTTVWNPNDQPIMLLHTVFDAYSIGEWIFSWAFYVHGDDSAPRDLAAELWQRLIKVNANFKQAKKLVKYCSNKNEEEMLEDFIESGRSVMIKLQKILRDCHTHMMSTIKYDDDPLDTEAGIAFLNAFFGEDLFLSRTQNYINGLDIWNFRFNVNCADILETAEKTKVVCDRILAAKCKQTASNDLVSQEGTVNGDLSEEDTKENPSQEDTTKAGPSKEPIPPRKSCLKRPREDSFGVKAPELTLHNSDDTLGKEMTASRNARANINPSTPKSDKDKSATQTSATSIADFLSQNSRNNDTKSRHEELKYSNQKTYPPHLPPLETVYGFSLPPLRVVLPSPDTKSMKSLNDDIKSQHSKIRLSPRQALEMMCPLYNTNVNATVDHPASDVAVTRDGKQTAASDMREFMELKYRKISGGNITPTSSLPSLRVRSSTVKFGRYTSGDEKQMDVPRMRHNDLFSLKMAMKEKAEKAEKSKKENRAAESALSKSRHVCKHGKTLREKYRQESPSSVKGESSSNVSLKEKYPKYRPPMVESFDSSRSK